MKVRLPGLGLVAGVLLGLPVAASAATPIHYSSAGITPGSAPAAITAGGAGDDDVWFTEPGTQRVASVTPAGHVTEFAQGITGVPSAITGGDDGNVWFTEFGVKRVARITPSGTVTEFSTGISGVPAGIARGPDGNVWFTEPDADKVAKIAPDGTVTEFPVGSRASRIAAAPDDRLWFTAPGALAAITPDGVSTVTDLSDLDVPVALAAGPADDMALALNEDIGGGTGSETNRLSLYSDLDTVAHQVTLSGSPGGMAKDAAGDLWVPEGDDRIMRVAGDGSNAEFRSDAALAQPIAASASGPDGRIWVTQPATNRIGVFDPKVALPPPDTTGPAISVTTPAASAHYAQGAHVALGFSCADTESAVTFCRATSGVDDAGAQVICPDWPALSRIPNTSGVSDEPGDALDTAQPGAHRFSSAAIDAAGETACVTRTYVVDPPAPGLPGRSTLRARLRHVGGTVTRALKRGGERRLARRHVIALKVHWPFAGRLTVTVRGAHGTASLAHGSRRLTSRKTAHLVLHTTKRGRQAARTARRHHHRLRLKLGLRFHASGGPTVTRRVHVTLNR